VEALSATSADAAGVWQWQSDLGRALDSTRILGEVLRLSVRLDPRLRELCLGVLAGRAEEEAMEVFADYFEEAKKNPWYAKPPGGESLAELRQRLLDFYAELASDGRYLVVSHVGPIRVAVWEASPRRVRPALALRGSQRLTYSNRVYAPSCRPSSDGCIKEVCR